MRLAKKALPPQSTTLELVQTPALSRGVVQAVRSLKELGLDGISILSLVGSVAAAHARAGGVSRADYDRVCDAVWTYAENECAKAGIRARDGGATLQ